MRGHAGVVCCTKITQFRPTSTYDVALLVPTIQLSVENFDYVNVYQEHYFQGHYYYLVVF